MEHLPIVSVAVLLVLSLRLDQPSALNSVGVIIVASLGWAVLPANSPLATAICYALTTLAVFVSPLRPLLIAVARSLLFPQPDSPASPTSKPENPALIEALHDPKDAELDILAVHGLGSSVEWAWTHKRSGRLWLRDFLQLDFPKARIMTFRHNSAWKAGALNKDLGDHGLQLLDALEGTRCTEKEQGRPLILIGHSFGGLLIEKALVIAKEYHADLSVKRRHESLANSVAGVIFLGTPHAGSAYSLLGKLYCAFHYWQGASPLLLGYLDPGSRQTRELEGHFVNCYRDLSFDYYESKQNKFLGINVAMVVAKDQGTRAGIPSCPLDTDHSGLNKFESNNDASYITIKNKMNELQTKWTVKRTAECQELDEKERKLLDDLEACDFRASNEDRGQKFTPRTCQWILEEPEIQHWEREAGVLWVFGKPGCGKTYIAQWMYKHLEKTRGGYGMYFFFDAKSVEAKDLRSLGKFYQTILHQLLLGVQKHHPMMKSTCFRKVESTLYEKGFDGNPYAKALNEVLSLTGPTYLVVDALDECKDADKEALRRWFSELKALPILRIVVTSRPILRVHVLSQECPGTYLKLDIDARVHKLDADIARYIEQRVLNEPGFPKEMPMAVEKLKKRASGMILYARLVLDILQTKVMTDEDYLDEMERLPESLTKLYAQQLSAIDDRKFAKRILVCLITCKRPLTVGGLGAVDAINRVTSSNQSFQLTRSPQGLGEGSDGSDRFRYFLQQHLLPLVEVLPDDTVRLVHATVSQFVLNEDVDEGAEPCPADLQVRQPYGHEFIALTCVAFLAWDSTGEEDGAKFVDYNDLRDYAVPEWTGHYEKSEELIMDEKNRGKMEAVVSFFRSETAFDLWLEKRAKIQDGFGYFFNIKLASKWASPLLLNPTPLHVAAFFNLRRTTRSLLEQADMDALDGTGGTALHVAAKRGHSETVQILLDGNASMRIADAGGFYPAHRAAQHGMVEALARLINHDESAAEQKDKHGFSPLHCACDKSRLDYTGLHEYNAVHELLQRSLGLYWEERRFSRHQVAEMLLGVHRVDANSTDKFLRTPLFFAARQGELEMVKCLVEHGADVNSQSLARRTALFGAAAMGHQQVMEYLLAAGADETKQDIQHNTALHYALGGDLKAETVRILAAEKTRPTWKLPDLWGQTVLHLAAMEFIYLGGALAEEVVNIVFQHGADPKARDWQGQTALHVAIQRPTQLHVRYTPFGFDDFIHRFVEMGVPLEVRDLKGRTALEIAGHHGQVEAIKTLVQAGAAPDYGCLKAIVRSSEKSLTEQLLKSASSLEIIDQHGNTCLHLAARECNADLVAALLEAGAPMRCLNMAGRTPLMEAEAAVGTQPSGSRSNTLRLLREADPRPEGDIECRVAQGIWGRGALHWVAEEGLNWDRHIRHGSLVNTQDDLGRTPLHLAVLSGNLKMVEQLIAAQADAGLADQTGRTPLHYLADRFDAGLYEALLCHGTSIDAADQLGRTPLHLAAQSGNVEAARLLVNAGAILRPDNQGNTPLHAAATWKHSRVTEANVSGTHAQICRLLLEDDRGVDELSAQNSRGETAVHYSARFRASSCEVLDEILKRARDPTLINTTDSFGQTALFWASTHVLPGYIEPDDMDTEQSEPEDVEPGEGAAVMKRLIEAGAIVYLTDNYGRMATHLVTSEAPDVKRLLADAIPRQVESFLAELNEPWQLGEGGCAFAAISEVLIDVGALVKVANSQDLIKDTAKWAGENRQRLVCEVVEGLRTWEAKPARALMQAVRTGDWDLVDWALAMLEGPLFDMDAHDALRRAACLAVSTQGERDDIVSRIVEDTAARMDMQIIQEARRNGHDDLLKSMLEHVYPYTSSVDPRDGSTMLHIAADRGLATSCWHLTRDKFMHIELNVLDKFGRTALHRACLEGHDDVVKVLLYFNETDLHIRDVQGRTPLELADRLGETMRARLRDKAEQQMRKANEEAKLRVRRASKEAELRMRRASEEAKQTMREAREWAEEQSRRDKRLERWLNEEIIEAARPRICGLVIERQIREAEERAKLQMRDAKHSVEQQMSIIETTARQIGEANMKTKAEQLMRRAEELAQQFRETREEVEQSVHV